MGEFVFGADIVFIHKIVNRWRGNKPRPQGPRLDSPFEAKEVVFS